MKTLKFALMCVVAIALVACGDEPEKVCPDCGNNPCTCEVVEEYVCPIKVDDASDADWAKVPEGYLFETKCAEGASWDALKSVKVFADEGITGVMAKKRDEFNEMIDMLSHICYDK